MAGHYIANIDHMNRKRDSISLAEQMKWLIWVSVEWVESERKKREMKIHCTPLAITWFYAHPIPFDPIEQSQLKEDTQKPKTI